MPNKFTELAEKVAQQTDAEFTNEFSSLTRLTNDDIKDLINKTGIDQKSLVTVMKVINDATMENEQKARSIQNINKGVDVLIGIAKRFI